ncbi:hypothetical protein [Lactiplantibacillus pentosus]|nr:hypothetical protein [Lactiplantibacillus pentosus]MDT6967103.1 hypothetical protein [Lactiplantibacillus pentosus]MDT6999970.1 hypothetical protein [Lactiplantibacillus pentosus]
MTINGGITLIKVFITWWAVSWVLRVLLIGGVAMLIYYRWYRHQR